jgi:hypothetical protein
VAEARKLTVSPAVAVIGVTGASIGVPLERTSTAPLVAAMPSASVAVKRKLMRAAFGAVKVACGVVPLVSVTAGPAVCCQR